MGERAQTVLVTGTNSGFGLAVARLLAGGGFRVFATMRDVTGRNRHAAMALRDWADQEDASLDVVELELTDTASIEAAVSQAIAAAGNIDVVVNNAGVGAVGVPRRLHDGEVRRLA